jgi:hypothetical protein
VFTARYALSPCIKQIRFVYKGLKSLCRQRFPTVLCQRTKPVNVGWLRAVRKKIIISAIPNGLNYCVDFIVYTQFRNLGAGQIIQADGPQVRDPWCRSQYARLEAVVGVLIKNQVFCNLCYVDWWIIVHVSEKFTAPHLQRHIGKDHFSDFF